MVWRQDGAAFSDRGRFRICGVRYGEGMTAATPHLLMSVSKSLVGCVAGILAGRGQLDPAAQVTAYVPEAGSSGYAGATVRGDVSATARDLARFGQLLIDDGRVSDGAGRAGSRQVVPAGWLAATRAPGPGVREAFAVTEHEFALPGGWYRNQFWVIPGPDGPVLAGLGIHGQLVYADQAARTVVAKLSSWPEPQHTAYLVDTLRACAALAAHLAAGGFTGSPGG